MRVLMRDTTIRTTTLPGPSKILPVHDKMLKPAPGTPFSILHDGLHDFAPSWQLPVLHSIVVAYNMRKRFTKPEHTFIQKILAHLLVALGGGTLSALLTARPVPLFTSNTLLPLYLTGHLLIHYTPFLFPLLTALSPLWEPLAAIIDAASRTWALTHGLDAFRAHVQYAHLSRDAIVGQFALGVVSVTAGGIIYKWSASPVGRYTWPGWDFGVVCFVTGVYVAYWDSSTLGVGKAAGGWVGPWVREYGGVVGLPYSVTGAEMRTVCMALMAVGFLAGVWAPVVAGGGGGATGRTVGRGTTGQGGWYAQQQQQQQGKGKKKGDAKKE
ncbi:uncharacterized protein EV422DRAFT_381522 [Fimicolochytrium jonesii]|uniref:uncharacterized protein n=1 Tax=Fimicolochytrium jonesii TaxID=1396493 RepID=UPI0022FEFF17|nr:uncharacterized protein EV422DRAFT_381522 [Fimicolochytrium jonesii]KAI8822863.1 hypothetical protein EV422DRAFT_381522 [Fimicolochytrium jonesii]